MASSVDIANRALTKLGQSRITALDQDTNNARVINAVYDTLRDAELRAHVWSFAITRASLAVLADAPLYQYSYQYQLPSDCLRLLEIEHFSPSNLNDYITRDDTNYKIEGNKILTNANAPLNIRYVKREEDTQQYSSDFVEAFACRLATECAETLTNSTSKRQLAWQEYKDAISIARRTNSLELPSQAIYDDSWMLSRL
jgi:hypothetical protein